MCVCVCVWGGGGWKGGRGGVGREGGGGRAVPDDGFDAFAGGGESRAMREQRSRSLPATLRKECIPEDGVGVKRSCGRRQGMCIYGM